MHQYIVSSCLVLAHTYINTYIYIYTYLKKTGLKTCVIEVGGTTSTGDWFAIALICTKRLYIKFIRKQKNALCGIKW